MFIVKSVMTSADVSSLFVSALEGGYSPWLEDIELVQVPSKFDVKNRTIWYGQEDFFGHDGYKLKAKFDREQDEESTFKGRKTITKASIQKGLSVMARDYPRHFSDALDEARNDAITADVFIQCVIFGKVIFG